LKEIFGFNNLEQRIKKEAIGIDNFDLEVQEIKMVLF
jgi:hypothetical protein